MQATRFICREGSLPQVDVLGDVVNCVLLYEEGSEYALWGFWVMCTSAAFFKDSDAPAFAFPCLENF